MLKILPEGGLTQELPTIGKAIQANIRRKMFGC